MSIELVILIALIFGILVGAFTYLLVKKSKPVGKTVYVDVERPRKADTEVMPAPPSPPQPTYYAWLNVIDRGFQHNYIIDKETYNIGREDDNEYVLPDSDLTTSRYHSRIRMSKKEEGTTKYVIADLNTKLGTIVNGKKVTQPQELNDKDIIEIGKTQMMFVCGMVPPPSVKTS